MPSPRPGDLAPVLRSTSRTTRLVETVGEDGITRYKLMTDEYKLNDEVKAKFIEEYAKHGRHGTASRIAGVSMKTIKKHMEKDPEFGQSCAEALECYKDSLIAHHQNLVFNGTVKTTYGRDGTIVSEETIYPIRLIELELKKHDEGYRDKKELSVNVRGGVLVAPSQVSMTEWETKFGSPSQVGDIIEGEVTDVGEDTSEDTSED